MTKLKLLIIYSALFCFATLSRAQKIESIQTVGLYLQDGVEILDFAGPMEVFIQGGLEVYTIADTKEPIRAMGQLTIVPDFSIEEAPKPDIIAFFGGGGATHKSQEPHIKSWVNEMVGASEIQFSVCTGAFYLGETGILDGQTATTFHSAIGSLQSRFPKAHVRDDVRYVDNGRIITTAGISAGIDGALHLISKLKGINVAKSVASNMEYFGWEPDKGLIIPNEFVETIKSSGMEKALKAYTGESPAYLGELMNAGKDLISKGQIERGLEVMDHAVKYYELSFYDCQTIGNAYREHRDMDIPSEQTFVSLIQEEKIEEAKKLYNETINTFPSWIPFREWRMNSMGYTYLQHQKYEEAIRIFQFNVEAFPKSFNTYDSLGEAYMLAGKKDLAIKNYEKSLQLNPENNNGIKMLEKIRAL